jgi:hypothetical protein
MYIDVKSRYHTQLHSKATRDSPNYWVFGLCPSSELLEINRLIWWHQIEINKIPEIVLPADRYKKM